MRDCQNAFLLDEHISPWMKLLITITGPKVHDVGYRYFLLGLAMSHRIRMFEAHNVEGEKGKEVLVLVDGGEKEVLAFRALAETRHPEHAEVSKVIVEDYGEEVMRIGEYAQFCATVQLNKAIPVLLAIRDNTNMIPPMKANTDVFPQVLEEIKGMREDIQPSYANDLRQVQADIRALKDRVGMQ